MIPGVVERAARFADLHREGVFVLPNPWDEGTARMLAALGAPALATTSAGLAFTRGLADGGAVGRADAIEHARLIAAATPLPVSADLENGYGPAPEDVVETVRQAIDAGLAGCSIEDSDVGATDEPSFPRRLAVERIVAAAETARGAGRPFVLTARADGVLVGGYDLGEAIARLQQFEAAGADVAYAPAVGGMNELRRVCRSVGIPVNALCAGPLVDEKVEAFAEAGVRRVSLGSTLARATHAVVRDAALAIFGEGSFASLRGGMAGDDVDDLLARGGVEPGLQRRGLAGQGPAR